MDETVYIGKPQFNGTKGPEYEKVCMKIEHLFAEHLQAVEAISEKILDVQQSTWYDDMFTFRTRMKDLEVIIENLVTVVFKGVNNVEEGIHFLFGFQNYMNRENLKNLFDSKTTEVSRINYQVFITQKTFLEL